MDPNLIIDDDFVNGVANNCIRNSENLEGIYHTYISLLRNIQTSALVSGEISVALAVFISKAEIYLKGNLDKISDQINDICDRFLIDINNADSYLF